METMTAFGSDTVSLGLDIIHTDGAFVNNKGGAHLKVYKLKVLKV
jgi:hypothetical protein